MNNLSCLGAVQRSGTNVHAEAASTWPLLIAVKVRGGIRISHVMADGL